MRKLRIEPRYFQTLTILAAKEKIVFPVGTWLCADNQHLCFGRIDFQRK